MNLNFFDTYFKARKQFVFVDKQRNISVSVLREDEIHPVISGNKFRKLKYNLLQAQKEGKTKLLTFGGAFSNHIAATAEAARVCGLESIGIIRGDELAERFPEILKENSTLAHAHQNGMQLHFETRENYRKKNSLEQLKFYKEKFGDFYLIPEGGTNELAIKGCKEILSQQTDSFDVICVSVGTGGTLAGLVEASKSHQRVIGFSALNCDYLTSEVRQMTSKENWDICYDFHFGGYAKVTDELVGFINDFGKKYPIALDPIYTGKMIYGISELIKGDFFPKNTRILAVHTGGLQGIEGCNAIRAKRGASMIEKVKIENE